MEAGSCIPAVISEQVQACIIRSPILHAILVGSILIEEDDHAKGSVHKTPHIDLPVSEVSLVQKPELFKILATEPKVTVLGQAKRHSRLREARESNIIEKFKIQCRSTLSLGSSKKG